MGVNFGTLPPESQRLKRPPETCVAGYLLMFCEVSSNSVHIWKSYSSTTGCFYLFIRLQYGGQFRNFTPESQRLKRPPETCVAGYLLMFCEVSPNSVHIWKSYSSTTGCFYLFIRLQYGGQFRNFTPESQRLKRPPETCVAGYLLMFCEVSSNSVHIWKSYSSTTGCFYLFIRLQYGGQFRNFTPESQRLKRSPETCVAGYLLMFCEVSSNSVHIWKSYSSTTGCFYLFIRLQYGGQFRILYPRKSETQKILRKHV